MKKNILALIALSTILALLLVGFDYLYINIMRTLGNFNNYLAQLILKAQTSPWAGPTLVGLSFLYGILHAIGPGHGKFVLASYSLATNPKFIKLVALGLTISLLQGVTAVVIGASVLYLFGNSVTYLFKLNDHLGVISGVLIGLLALFWLCRSLYRSYKIIKLIRAEKLAHQTISAEKEEQTQTTLSNDHKSFISDRSTSLPEQQASQQKPQTKTNEPSSSTSCCHHPSSTSVKNKVSATSTNQSTCCSHHHQENIGDHQGSSCNHQSSVHAHHHDHNCNCGNHMDWDKFNQLDSFRDRLIMATSIILRPCSGALAVLIFGYAVDLWWWGVVSTMMMAVGTGIGLIFAVQLVTLIKHLGFNKLFGRASAFKSLFIQGAVCCIAIALMFVSLHTAYISYTSQDNIKIYTRSSSRPLLQQNNADE
ncbi:nickel/cobalt transporter [Psittacicella gerlachiana]|uniref:Nickel/cobalt efflux system n=1 Tax=Psittacicella gerlachiana TaxID=2028574 RepID=A0A3A1Y4C4_9GAMM|nr:hypothetical protein [Psittacicella gerlachiana]RIY33093.1 hypothetical protein CKF59_06575 [Psittacicella gerlachiana]